MSTVIHPTAIVDKKASLGENVVVGPFAVIDADSNIGDGCRIDAHAVVGVRTTIGKNSHLYPGAVAGTDPQDLKFEGETTTLIVGENTIIREYCTLNRGTVANGATMVGNNCAILAYGHVAHDCVIGDNVVISNNLALAGHVTVGNNAGIAGMTGVVQFCRIGEYSFVGAQSLVTKDVVPYALCAPHRGEMFVVDINKVGLERKGFDEDRRRKIKRAFKTLFRSGLTVLDAVGKLDEEHPGDADILLLTDFVKLSKKGIYGMRNE